MADSEQTIVINDLLSFLSCKIKSFPKDKVAECLNDFYPKSAIIEAEKTLVASLAEGESSKFLKRKKEKDPFKNLFNIFEKVSVEDLPIFVCKNLNNVPKLEKEESNETGELDEEVDELVTEQKFIKSQIAEISSVVYQLKDQIQLLAKHRMKNKKSIDDGRNGPENVSMLKTFYKDQKNISTNNNLGVSKANGLAYLQTLIDEEEQEKKSKLDSREESFVNFEEMEETGEEEAENLIQLIANRQQRALVKTVEAEVLSGNRKKIMKKGRTSVKRKLETSAGSNNATSKVLNTSKDDSYSDPDEEEIELLVDNDEFTPVEDYDDEDDAGTTIIKKRKNSRSHIVTEEVEDESIGKLMVHKCTLCNFSTNDESSINRHECPQIHGGKEVVQEELRTFKYFCLECKFRSNNKALHQRHLEKHPQYFACSFCDEKYEDPEDWTDHVLQCIRDGDHKQEDHICPVCNVIYATHSALRLHRGNHDLTRQFECSVCRFRFRTEEKLESHMRIHNARGFKCPFCTYVHKNKYTFQTHIRSHTGETPFACDLCDYRCTSSSAIASHMLCHTNVRDKKCDECPALFKTIQKLNAHKKIHRKGHDFRCPVCQESFRTAWLMTMHHTGAHVDPQQVLPCPLCFFTADSKEDLKSHVEMHEFAIVYQCSLCDFNGDEKGMLDAHMKQAHLMLGV